MIPETFHFLRPLWLAAILPVALLAWSALHAATRSSAWHRVVDAHLLRHLLLTDAGTTRRWPAALGALAGIAASVALAGPTWEKIPQPTFTTAEPTVVVLDLSPAMQVDDLAPSRLGRARLELRDLLERTKGAQVGLVLYTDEPFVAAPLTDDGRLIEELIPTLETGLMPLRAGRADRALAQAKALLDQAGAASGRVLLVTPGLGDHADATLAAARELAASGRTLSVLGAGTDDGAPSRDARRRIEHDANGAPVLAKLDRAGLEALAAAGGGRFSEVRADDSDLAMVAPARAASALHAASAGSSAQFDVWHDAGIWLVLIPLAVAPLLFRRGLVAALAFAVLAAAPGRAEASAWDDLWSRPDQQGEAALAAGDAASAAGLFEDPAWQAAATYESGTYDDAAAKYASLGGTANRYNLGNALAKSGKLEDAVAQYEEVLKQSPQHADAKFNRDLVQRLLDEQRQQQQQQQQSNDQQQDGEGQPQQQNADGASGGQNEPQKDDRQAQSGEQDRQNPQDGAQPPNSDDPQGSGEQTEQQEQAKSDDPHGSDEQDQQQEQAKNDDPQGSGKQTEQQEQATNDADAEPRNGQKQDQENSDGAGAEQPPSPDDATASAGAAPKPDQQQERPQQAARGNDGEPNDEPHEQDPAAAARNEAAQQDESLKRDLDRRLADDAQQDEQPQDENAPKGTASSTAKKPLTEQEQAREQALRNIPDDPAGLLRAKIRRQYAEQRYSQKEVSPSW
ncbi:MAG: VWA domain-containing protein [Deltaproteobacteria bacterium]|nr:VWA domain-containing protein [Deltaproteobacteria bacterium]